MDVFVFVVGMGALAVYLIWILTTQVTKRKEEEAALAKRPQAPPLRSFATDAEIVLYGAQGKSAVVKGGTVTLVKDESKWTTRRERALPIRNITSVEVKQPGAFVGFIQFSIAGGAARDASYTMTGGSFDAVKDENSIVFSDQESYSVALRIKEYVKNYCAPPPTTTPSNVSAADEILKLKGLLDRGIISAAEFEAKKRQLLGI